MSTAYSYFRFSHPDQAKGDSIRRQTALRDAWLARNGIALDTSLSLADKGISAFTGDHRHNADRHALASFLHAVEKGRIAKGSYLVVESLDRLTREHILPALTLVLNLIQSGVKIVQLLPVEMVYDDKANPMHVMMMIMELSRGHSESVMKSERIGEAWQVKKLRAAEHREPLSSMGPAWLRFVDGEWQLDEQPAKAVRLIFRLATDGHGIGVIASRLNNDKVPPIGRSEHWAPSYVSKILNNRATIGEYQPRKRRGQKRETDGKPVPGYYPAVITEDEFYAARARCEARRGIVGRQQTNRVNIFSGLLRNARDGGNFKINDKGKKGAGRMLVPSGARQGTAKYTSFPLAVFERLILPLLREIDPRSILPKKDGGPDRVLAITGRLTELESAIEKVKTRYQRTGDDAVADVLERQEAERKSLVDQLAEERRKAASPLGESWGRLGALLDAADPEARIALRTEMRQITESITCLFVRRGASRVAAVQFHFRGGSQRSYLLAYRPVIDNRNVRNPARSRAVTADHAIPGFDLRDPKHAGQLEKELLRLDIGMFLAEQQDV
jgi:DNA invertase Pin-like site-specific DNA recombinase